MKTSLRYLIVLIFILTAALIIVAAQEDYKTSSNNNSQNVGINFSAKNNTVFNITDTEKSNPLKTICVLNRDTEIDLANNIGFNTYDVARRVNAFLIDGYVRPTKDAIYKNESSLNAACLSRAVEGTPHGYVTYYN
jgi:hypothetical protein